jgi:hypothetical protein
MEVERKETVITDPLATVRLYLQINPNEEENRALRKLLESLVNLDGTFHVAEAILFQGELGKLTAALIDARMAGRYRTSKTTDCTSSGTRPQPALENVPSTHGRLSCVPRLS